MGYIHMGNGTENGSYVLAIRVSRHYPKNEKDGKRHGNLGYGSQLRLRVPRRT